jgi:hypothetical protein
MIGAGGKTVYSDFHICIHSIWNKEELPQQYMYMKSTVVPTYKGDKTDRRNYLSLSLLSLYAKIIQHPSVKLNYIHTQN